MPHGRGAVGGTTSRPSRHPAASPADARRRLRRNTLAYGSIALVLVTVLVMVLVSVMLGPGAGPAGTPAQASVLGEVEAVTMAEAASVGLPSSVAPPLHDTSKPPLVGAGGKPVVLYIGGEFCPNCAAERWALVMALSRFGTFANLHQTTSSPWDSDPSTATFTFYRSTFTSAYLDLQAVENVGNDTSGAGTRKVLVPLTPTQAGLFSQYTSKYGQPEGFPFLDIGNRVLFLGGSFSPAVLANLSWSQIAARLAHPQDPVAQAIVGAANYVTAGICSVVGKGASPWCTSAGVVAAARKIGLPS